MKTIQHQRGFVLLLIVLVLIAVGGTVFLVGVGNNQINSSARQIEVTKTAFDVLTEAKSALIGFSIGVQSGGSRPGQLLPPDTLENSQYDGLPDNNCLDGTNASGASYLTGASAKSANLRCIGRLPWRRLNLQLKDTSAQDILGNVPWYVASENLADPNFCMSVLNPNTASGNVAMYSSCPIATGPAWPWLKVCDSSGKILSDRVAFVLIAPGPAIQTASRLQTRATISSDPRNFLDDVPAPLGWNLLPPTSRCSTFDNAGLKGEFIVGEQSRTFNDRILYVTIDELMLKIEKKVAAEVSESVIKHKNDYGTYPWLAPIKDPSPLAIAATPTAYAVTNSLATLNTGTGFIPFQVVDTTFRFMTEVSWVVTPPTNDMAVPTLNLNTAATSFPCYGGDYQCRIRSLLTTPIPRTVTTIDFESLKSGSLSTSTAACSFTTNTAISCEPFDYSSTTVSYNVQYRLGGVGAWTTLPASYAGKQTRKVTLGAISSGSFIPSPAKDNEISSRSISSNSVLAALDVTDKWSPNNNGPTHEPFDLFNTPLTTGQMYTLLSNPSVISKIRSSPILPAWYYSEKWYESTIVTISADSTPNSSGNSVACSAACLSAGNKSGLDAVVISSGVQLKNLPSLSGDNQNRYVINPTIGQFLEPPNIDINGASTRLFAQPNTKHSPTYADTIATIPR